jgi:hypothetical protein
MSYSEVSAVDFSNALSALSDALGEVVRGLYMPMIEYDHELRCVIRTDATDSTQLPPPGFGAYLIHGDLTVDTALSLSHLNAPDADGNMIFIVTGNVTCPRFISEWGSIVIVGGDLAVSELMFIAREDSSHFVLGDISVWALIGRDIWVSFEADRQVEIAYGFGYALPRLGSTPGDSAVRPRHSEAESAVRLNLKDMEALSDLDLALYHEDVPSFRHDTEKR